MKKQMLAVLVGMSLCAMPIWAADGAAKESLKHVDLGGTFNYAGQPTPFTNEQVLSNIANLNETLEKSVGYTGVSEAAAFIVMEEKSAGILAQLGNLPGGYGDKAKEMYNAVQNSVKERLQKRFGVTEARLQEVYQEFKAAGGDAEKIAAIGQNDGEKRLVAALQAPGQTRVMETTLMNALPNVQNTVNAAIDQVNENTNSIAGLQNQAAEVGTLKQNIATLDSRLTSEVNRLDTRIDRVGALTGALAGLKPIQYDPAAPTQIMAAVSTYEGKQGFALGLAHYAKENLMIHAGVAYDGDEKYMGNLGMTLKLGNGSGDMMTASPAVVRDMQDELTGLQEQNQRIRAELAALRARIR